MLLGIRCRHTDPVSPRKKRQKQVVLLGTVDPAKICNQFHTIERRLLVTTVFESRYNKAVRLYFGHHPKIDFFSPRASKSIQHRLIKVHILFDQIGEIDAAGDSKHLVFSISLI